MAVPVQHADNRKKHVLIFDGFALVHSERPAAVSGTEYVSYESPNGEWIVIKNVFDATTNIRSFSSQVNNAAVTTEAAAWAARATLTYGTYGEVWEQ